MFVKEKSSIKTKGFIRLNKARERVFLIIKLTFFNEYNLRFLNTYMYAASSPRRPDIGKFGNDYL